ncbi:hypothetical protein B0A48_11936 [Cryoendolithus antarcticus]|uniref:Acyltransferase 3 domain-containing protein n=1 Tax=Cryoendolithus antarcticus TaxID=1507870 RepID=A0A1V8SU29_9PEZI|nr:hypothetical protein B0A48_11936 [Cryoendolithus antarcticus]
MLPEPEITLEKGYLDQLETHELHHHLPSNGKSGGLRLVFSMISALLRAARPAFLRWPSGRKAKLRRTAYLDGLRGFAALMVYCLHHELWAHESMKADKKLESAWGYEGNYYLACFHFVRTFFSGGHYAVTTFFVISGYVLSLKPIGLMNAGQYDKLLDNISSAMFRRWLRLWIPIIFVTFGIVIMWHVLGVQANAGAWKPEKTLRAGLWTWYVDIKNYTWIFSTGGKPWFDYNPHIWSIPVEAKGSVAIYTTLLALAKCSRKARMWCQVALMWYMIYVADGAHFAMFIAGMFICEVDYIAAENGLPDWITDLKEWKTVFFHCLLAVSMFLGGVPSYDRDIVVLRESPGWYLLSFLKPQAVFDYKWFFLFWAASSLVITIPRIGWLKRFFETGFCQYLGRISYMFYLLHGPIMWSLGDRVYASVGWTREAQAMLFQGWAHRMEVPQIGPFGMELNFYVPHLILFPFTLWMAEMGTTLIDDNAVKFCAWLYKQTIDRPSDRPRAQVSPQD